MNVRARVRRRYRRPGWPVRGSGGFQDGL
jgi:hypothetical protein